MNLEAMIETVLFARGEGMERSRLAEFLKESPVAIDAALERLHESLGERGIRLVDNGTMVALRSAPGGSDLIERLRKEELERDLSKAALETLSIILYAGPLPRTTIDFIRGVNSQFILRSLMTRGLIEREADPADERRLFYRPSLALLSHLGISRVEELPEYADFRGKLAESERAAAGATNHE